MHDAALLVDYGWYPLLGRSVVPAAVLAASMLAVSLLLFLPWRWAGMVSVIFTSLGIGLTFLPRITGTAVELPMQVPPSAPKVIVGLALATGLALWWRRSHSGDAAPAAEETAESQGLLATFSLALALGAGLAAVLFGLRLGNLWTREAASSILVLVFACPLLITVLARSGRRACSVIGTGLALLMLVLIGWREREWSTSSWTNELEQSRPNP